MLDTDKIRAALIDLDGTVHFRGSPIPGAAEAIVALRSRGLALRFLTNADSKPPSDVHVDLVALGLPVRPEEIFSPPLAALAFLSAQKDPRCYCLLSRELRSLFSEYCTETAVQYVLIGDCRDTQLPGVEYGLSPCYARGTHPRTSNGQILRNVRRAQPGYRGDCGGP